MGPERYLGQNGTSLSPYAARLVLLTPPSALRRMAGFSAMAQRRTLVLLIPAIVLFLVPATPLHGLVLLIPPTACVVLTSGMLVRQVRMVEKGVLPPLVTLLKSPEERIQELAGT